MTKEETQRVFDKAPIAIPAEPKNQTLNCLYLTVCVAKALLNRFPNSRDEVLL